MAVVARDRRYYEVLGPYGHLYKSARGTFSRAYDLRLTMRSLHSAARLG